MSWRTYNGVVKWRINDNGYLVFSAPSQSVDSTQTQDGWLYRTKGEPETAKAFVGDFGKHIEVASARFGVKESVIFGIAAVEATRRRNNKKHLDARSLRLEPGWVSDEETPHRVSPGLMQTLISTAQEVNRKHKVFLEAGKPKAITRHDLFEPEASLMLGTAFLSDLIARHRLKPPAAGAPSDDPVFLCVAYNAGSVRKSSKNIYGMVTHAEDRVDRFAAFHNDLIYFRRSQASDLKGLAARESEAISIARDIWSLVIEDIRSVQSNGAPVSGHQLASAYTKTLEAVAAIRQEMQRSR